MFTTKKNKTRTMLSTLLSVFVLAGMLALPAQADSLLGLIVFDNGEAEIGVEQINETDKNDCSKAGSGLNFPLSQDGQSGDLDLLKTKNRCYTFAAGETVGVGKDGNPKPGTCTAIVNNKGTSPVDCSIIAHGNVSGFCGNSNGSEGWGEVTLANSQVIHLKNIRWATSVGSVFAVHGEVGKDNLSTPGTFAGLVQAFGSDNDGQSLAAACAETNGATAFQVRGVAVAVDGTQSP